MKKCLFVTTPTSDCSYYCGNSDNMDDVLAGIRNLICVEDVYAIMGIENNDICPSASREIVFKVKEMTDEEIEAIPEM